MVMKKCQPQFVRVFILSNLSSVCQGQKTDEFEQAFETNYLTLVSLLESNLQIDLPVIRNQEVSIRTNQLNNGGLSQLYEANWRASIIYPVTFAHRNIWEAKQTNHPQIKLVGDCPPIPLPPPKKNIYKCTHDDIFPSFQFFQSISTHEKPPTLHQKKRLITKQLAPPANCMTLTNGSHSPHLGNVL